MSDPTTSNHSGDGLYDVAIIGGGIAGSCAAHLLVRAGLHVALIDQREKYPNCFKAEKVEPDQVALLRKFGLFQHVSSIAERVREILVIRNDQICERLPIEQYGVAYHDLVNSIRDHFPEKLNLTIGRVVGVDRVHGQSTITLQDGGRIQARIVILAAGTAGALYRELGIERTVVQNDHSLCFGFTVAAQNGEALPFDSITIYPRQAEAFKVGYVTLFKTRAGMRVNLFTYWKAKEGKVRAFMEQPLAELSSLFPELAKFAGPLSLTSKVEACPIDLFVSQDPQLDGLVLAADSFQSVCPTTGLGLSKVLTDIDLLCHSFIPRWLAANDVSADRISEFYAHQTKRGIDSLSLRSAYRQRQLGSSSAWRWKLHRRLISLRPSLRRLFSKLRTFFRTFIWRCERSSVRPQADKA